MNKEERKAYFEIGSKLEELQNVHSHMDRRVSHKVMLAIPVLFAINTT